MATFTHNLSTNGARTPQNNTLLRYMYVPPYVLHPSLIPPLPHRSDHTIRIWHKERTGWQQRHVLDGQHSRTIRAVSYSPCGNFLASASFDGTACIYEQTDGEWDCLATLEG